MNENFDPIRHTPTTDVDPEPMPFEFKWTVPDKLDDHDIPVTVSGFWDFYYQKVEELTILDKFKNDITELFNDEDTVREIENYVKLNIL